MSDAMFLYDVGMDFEVNGVHYESYRNWRTNIQLRAGDIISIGLVGIDEIAVRSVVWELGKKGSAFLGLEPQVFEFDAVIALERVGFICSRLRELAPSPTDR